MAETNRVTLAVGAVIFRGPSEVLLIRRGRPPFEGQWSIPGGKVDYGERLEAALKREILEETGVEIAVMGLINLFEAVPAENGARHYVMADYACRYLRGDVRAGDDALEAAFVTLSEARARLSWDETRLAVQQAIPYVAGEDGGN